MQSKQACMYLFMIHITHSFRKASHSNVLQSAYFFNCGNRTNYIRHYAEMNRSTFTAENLGRLTGANTKQKTLFRCTKKLLFSAKVKGGRRRFFPSRLFIAKKKLYNVGQSTFF